MVLYLYRMCQWGLHAVLWSHIGTLMHRLAAEPYSTAELLFPSRCPSGTNLLTPYSMVWDWLVSRAGPMLLYWHKLLYPNYSLPLFFLFLFFLSIGWYCGAGVFGLIGCTSPSLSLALPIFINNNNKLLEVVLPRCSSYVLTRVYRILEGGLSSAIRWRRRQWWIHWRVFLGNIYRIHDVYHNNSNNLEDMHVRETLRKSIILWRNLLMFGNNSKRVSILSLWRSKDWRNRFVINEIWKLISIKSLIFRFHNQNMMLLNGAMLK